jgi:hypothetical protein
MLKIVHLFLISVLTAGAASDFGIPEDAHTCAERYLEAVWKPTALRNPAVFNVTDDLDDPSSAVLGEPYHFFELSPDSTRAYVSSETVDPRRFASRHLIHFPVLAEGKMICVIEVVQLDDTPEGLEDVCGLFVVRGYAVGGTLKTHYDFLSVPEVYGLSDATLSVISFWTPAGATWHMFPTSTGAHIVFFRHAEGFLDETARRFKRELRHN